MPVFPDFVYPSALHLPSSGLSKMKTFHDIFS